MGPRAILKSTSARFVGPRLTEHLIFFLKHPISYWRLRGYVSISGWLGYLEAVYLYRATRRLRKKTSPKILEIGTWLGKSTVVLGTGIKGHPGARIYCIDPFDFSGDPQSQPTYEAERDRMNLSLKETFLRNLDRAGLRDQVEILHGYSHEVTWDKPIDLLFIDGNHAYEAVKGDYEKFAPFLVRGGILIMDDVFFDGNGHAGPARIVRECILNNFSWYGHKSVGTLFSVRKK